MDLNLKGKTALVTGSTAGIGKAIAQLLAEEGSVVYINGRTQNRVDEAIEEIKNSGVTGELRGIAVDLGEKEGFEKLLQVIPQVDILVNNLGIYEVKPFDEITDEDWMRLFEVNVLSGIRTSRAYLPKMLEKDWGRIVFISSESAVNTPVEMIHYGVTKTAQLAVSRGLAELCAGTGVTVNSVLVGPTYSEGVEAYVQDMAKSRGVNSKEIEEEFFVKVRPTSLLKRFETTEEVANAVVYLCSECASAITGDAVRVDGGTVRSIL